MIKVFLLLLLIATSASAEDDPKPVVRSSEQAIAHFQQLRDTELKTVLSDDQWRTVTSFRNASSLVVTLTEHWEFEAARSTDQASRYADPLGPNDNEFRLIGKFSAVADIKNSTWRLTYGDRKGSRLDVFLDAITGRILYLFVVPGL